MSTPDYATDRENFCYRHPDRQSFVLCQRCTRTICPQCQTQGPVGVVCPECMKAQRKAESPAQKRARRAWGGGAVAIGGSSGKPVITYALLAVTTVIGLLQMLPVIGDQITGQLLFAAAYLYPDLSSYAFEPWRLITAMFVHGGFIHLALNMLSLWMLGQLLEPMLGRWRFLSLYLISGLGGSVAVAILAPQSATVGASGGLFGLMAALLIIGRHIGANVTGILVILGINFFYGFFVARVSWQAHLGGLLVGALIAFLYTRTKRGDQRIWQITGLVAITVLLLVVVAVVPPILILS